MASEAPVPEPEPRRGHPAYEQGNQQRQATPDGSAGPERARVGLPGLDCRNAYGDTQRRQKQQSTHDGEDTCQNPAPRNSETRYRSDIESLVNDRGHDFISSNNVLTQ